MGDPVGAVSRVRPVGTLIAQRGNNRDRID
jgi:hypothetical protein